MPRQPRVDIADAYYHVLNRTGGKRTIFRKEKDYEAFENVLEVAKDKFDMRIYSYCIMPNHWHLVLSPKADGLMGKFMQYLAQTHTQRYNVAHNRIGCGQLYQGRYKSFLVGEDEYFLQLCRYVERNPLKASLVRKAEDWRWSSLHRRLHGNRNEKNLLTPWPTEYPKDLTNWINEIQDHEKQTRKSIDACIEKNRPYGSEGWTLEMEKKYKLYTTINNRGKTKN